MSTTLIIAVGIGILVALIIALKSRTATPSGACIRDIPAIVEALRAGTGRNRFAHFIFGPADSNTGSALNLQYSVENDIVGLDWVLITPENIRDKDAVSGFAKQHGFLMVEKEMNKVKYLRVEGSGVVELGTKIIGDFYKIDPDELLDLVVDGFEWKPAQS